MEQIQVPDLFQKKKNEKAVPLDENGNGNSCPVCGSKHLIIRKVFSIEQEYSLKTGKAKYMINGHRTCKTPSLATKAALYDKAISNTPVSFQYSCEKCAWSSKWFEE